ncbi:helix-turn-helix transcriptional regulator [Altererythrobacter sp.]|nr:helix-turn-helix transcriptional regulator [Altererythrobacter sp.]
MINRVRDIRRDKGWTLADLAEACSPPTTAQTIGRLETGMRNLSTKWMDRIADALGVEPEMLVRSERSAPAQIVATLGADGPEALPSPRDAMLPTDIAGSSRIAGPLMVLIVDAASGPYLPGDQLWLRQLDPGDASRAINRDVLIPKKAGRFGFGRLIDRQGKLIGLLPPGSGQKQDVINDPPWIAVAEMLVRKL